ncbi:MAG: 1-acyl-sn-glycerol-3-phosphate acyltransferase [Flammeovirgaceae bacterium]|jgi:1-acyl-sn-glycerol-3-phosphate acyltransferase
MLKPKFHPISTAFWDWYIHRIIKSDFHEPIFEPDFKIEKTKSVLILANHFSWWDGFFVYELNRLILGKRFHVMMLEEQLRKNPFLKRVGAYSIDKSSGRKSLESLNYSAELLHNPNNLVLMFPQGQIESVYSQNLTFQGGVGRIIKQLETPTQILFCINLPDYHSNRKPTLRSYFEVYEGEMNLENLKSAFLGFHKECLGKQAGVLG